ncbi:BTB/POZ and MATH domain-containing protein 1-like [Lolium rigidum]|uniref:BTB/POZ and MATH domain-containing protein 1-like n=1 Tax=Lolium rigidum TaxID=89674 RepID=UPI001F5C68D7|nr:BTB/POZ and MATH domain-containing protein 1-like [Lolium rigidum]
MAASHAPVERMTSRCTAATVRATLAFEIVGYSLLKGMGVKNFIESTTFSVGGYKWCISCCLDLLTEKTDGEFIAAYLELLSEEPDVRALYDLRFVNKTSGLSSSVNESCLISPRLFSSLGRKDGFVSGVMERSKLEGSALLQDDCLVIECDLTVIKEPLVAETVEVVQIPPSNLSDNLGKLLETGDKADVEFNVKGEVFPAHKIVLAMRSPVFNAELYGPMRDQTSQKITVEDIQPDVFKALLHFIYTDSLPSMEDVHDADENKEMVKHLLVAADRYAIERLKMICECILCKSLDVKSVATMLALADQHQCSRLKDACVEFVASSNRMDDVVATQGYAHLKRSCPAVLVDIYERVTKSRKI